MTPELQEWFERHEAVVAFRGGKRIAIELRRPDGLRVQGSGRTWADLLVEAARLINRSGTPNGSPGDSDS